MAFAPVAPVMSVHDVPFVDDCQRYVIVPIPPLAAVVDVNDVGAVPEEMD